ncbi:LOW QUALITY PROTEIN: cilia- and flagella-associated protein 221 [Ctenopharyngodon idella]|uniref:LOW QUALITY PROTEIN: cilia- and flagella-associated protein 221 n=1 Tax=Ctenopharyngodon idella TaxID=7959 RepID=UPI002231972A|nr:LOW QUALITY PROTEIN: cilia- and flagella-associated protein 221 [Ctenopharyngodon idella]
MEVVHSAPETFSRSVKKKNLLPLSQLLEDTRKSGNVPHHLLETRVFAKLKSNSIVQAEPSELHFSGFEVGKDYRKILKLVNVSSEVLSVHILPPQTRHFQIKYTKKCRLVPGLAYTVTVLFRPDEWRYFSDNIRIHGMGEENLLVPVHAYPVINDLHIPSHISLPPVPLGQSASHVIPLSCSCPIDFEFEVHCLQPHKAFTVRPLSGIIPANGKTTLKVTFTPVRYGTADITLQLVISQFNSKPVIWTVTGSSSPYLLLSKPEGNGDDDHFVEERKTADGKSLAVTSHHKLKTSLSLEKGSKKKTKPDLQLQVSTTDVTTHAGLVKMLLQPQDKIRYKDLREAMSYTKVADQTREMKEAAFLKKVQQKEEKANHIRWQVDLGDDPCSTEQKLKILKEQDEAVAAYKLKYSGEPVPFSRSSTKLFSRRILRDVGQFPECTADFISYGSGQLEVRHRALRLFQQAARKVVLQCRMNKRLVSLRELVHKTRSLQGDKESDGDEKPHFFKLTPEKLLPTTFNTFIPEDQPVELAGNALGHVTVRMPEADMKLRTPLFNLKVPQRYRLLGYQPLSVYDAAATFVPPDLCRTLRTGAQDELLPVVRCPSVELSEDDEDKKPEEDDESDHDLGPTLSFSAPEALLRPPNAHPLRIFNPAPHVYAFKPAPLYLECDLDFHLCPLPRYTVPKGNVVGVHAPQTQKKFLDRKDIIKGIMTWKKFPSMALSTLSNISTLRSDCAPRMSDPFSIVLLPVEAPPALQGLPDSIRDEIQAGVSESSDLCLTPEMIEAEFGLSERSSATSVKEDQDEGNGSRTPVASVASAVSTKRDTREQPLESTQNNRLGPKVLGRLKELKSTGRVSCASSCDNK